MPASAGLVRLSEMPAASRGRAHGRNLLAPVQLARLLLPGMAERRAGHLVFVSSIAGATGVRYEAVYAATKAGLNCLAESLRYEMTGNGVGVSVVLPGAVDTPFFSRRGRPYERRWPAPIATDQVARAIIGAVTQHGRAEVYVPGWLPLPGLAARRGTAGIPVARRPVQLHRPADAEIGDQRSRRNAGMRSWSAGHLRYRITATGVNTTISRADQASARPTSLLDPVSSDRTASTMGVIGWYFENGCSQPGMDVAGT